MKNFFIVLGSTFLIISGGSDLSAKSQGASSWGYETSFAALTMRSIGGLKIGLGILALSALNISSENSMTKSTTISRSKEETINLLTSKNATEDEIWETLMNLLNQKNRNLADRSKSKFIPSESDPRFSICKSDSMEIAIGNVEDPYADKWEWRVVEF